VQPRPAGDGRWDGRGSSAARRAGRRRRARTGRRRRCREASRVSSSARSPICRLPCTPGWREQKPASSRAADRARFGLGGEA
jgi:hypothetical protein